MQDRRSCSAEMRVADNVQQVLQRIRDAELKYQRPANSVMLLAVSKKHPCDLIRAAYSAGQKAFGEAFLQEALEKQDVLQDCQIDWHFIGSIQSNKTRKIAEHFNWVHSVNSLKIAERLNQQRPDALPPLNVCIEVNVSEEATKSGCTPAALFDLALAIQDCPRLQLRGLMVIPEHQDDFSAQKAIFDQVAALQQQLIRQGCPLDTLSMGMTGDRDAAIAAGSTCVRIGTGIFGERTG